MAIRGNREEYFKINPEKSSSASHTSLNDHSGNLEDEKNYNQEMANITGSLEDVDYKDVLKYPSERNV